jgi:chemotaxis protein methyltransferase CheR
MAMSLPVADLDFIRKLVLDHSAIVLEREKAYLVETRLTPLATRLGFESISAMVAKIRYEPVNGTHRMVVDAMTTNETYFFRDIHPFTILRSDIFPQLIKAREETRKLRVWCGACSTGQEPLSVSMLWDDAFPRQAAWEMKITATDLSQNVLKKAKSGEFTQMEVNRGLPAPMLIKYFEKDHNIWRVRDRIRSRISYQEMNLAKPFPILPKFDLILLRNVLIYFDLNMKKQILANIRRVMAPDAFLFLGAAETTMNIDPAFQSVIIGKTVCYKLKG